MVWYPLLRTTLAPQGFRNHTRNRRPQTVGWHAPSSSSSFSISFSSSRSHHLSISLYRGVSLVLLTVCPSRALAHPLTRTPKNSLGFFFQSQNLFTELESLCPDLPAIPWICLLQQFPKSCAPQSQSSQSGTKPRDSLNIRSRTLTRPLGFLHQNHHIAKLTSISVSSPTERAAREKATCSLERHFKSKPANGCVDPTRLHALRLDHPRTLASHTGGEASVFPTRSTHLNLQSFVEQQQQTR